MSHEKNQNTFRNVKRDNRRSENTSDATYPPQTGHGYEVQRLSHNNNNINRYFIYIAP